MPQQSGGMKRIGFYCELPPLVVSLIRKQAKKERRSQWEVVALAILPPKVVAPVRRLKK